VEWYWQGRAEDVGQERGALAVPLLLSQNRHRLLWKNNALTDRLTTPELWHDLGPVIRQTPEFKLQNLTNGYSHEQFQTNFHSNNLPLKKKNLINFPFLFCFFCLTFSTGFPIKILYTVLVFTIFITFIVHDNFNAWIMLFDIGLCSPGQIWCFFQ
jgi:hypothetical protein